MVVHGINNYVYGGYTSQNWNTSGTYQNDQQAFLFVLRQGTSYSPVKYKAFSGNSGIWSNANIGPYFAYGNTGNTEFGLFTGAGVNKYTTSTYYGGAYFAGQYVNQFCGGTSGGNVQITDTEVYKITGRCKFMMLLKAF